ncbi:MAG: acetylxylan esterase, partial [Lentisphaeria bacterium]|nr:acetylxylan esterase [Lentisphaeria bacterium]
SYPSIIWCCDMAGTTKKQRCHGGWRVKHTPILDYFDPVFMAKRIKNAQVHITRAGLGDYICPPSGLAICYRNLVTPHKKIVWVQGSSHDFTPADAEKVIWANE